MSGDLEARLDGLEERALTDGSLEIAMLRKFAYRLGDVDEDDVDDTPLPVAVNQAIDRVESLEDRVDELETRVDATEEMATIDNSTRADGSGETKIERAMRLSRDQVVEKTLTSSGGGGMTMGGTTVQSVESVTNTQVQNMSDPEVTILWQTVDDAWGKLISRWDAFRVDESGEDKKLTLKSAEAVTPGLAKKVEKSLGRDDLTKRLVGGRE